MRIRTLLTTGVAAAALTIALPLSAQAKETESFSRSLFDGTPERTVSSLRLAGLTAGPLGGALDVTFTASDGSLPTVRGTSEPVDVTAVLTLSPGEVLTIRTTGEASVHQFGDVLQVNAYYGKKDVTYEGTEHKKVKVVGDGLIGAAQQWYGAQASVSGTLSW
jgi:hypothetical protein